MRMWMIDPQLLCRRHLLGEHCESHMLVGTLKRGKSIQGHLDRGQLEPTQLQERHTALADEMLKRGMNHQSPLEPIDVSAFDTNYVDAEESKRELQRRCPDCCRRIK